MEHSNRTPIINNGREFVLLCLVEHLNSPNQLFVFATNETAYIVPGTDVVVDTRKGWQIGVVREITIVRNFYEAGETQFIQRLAHATVPFRRIVKKIDYTDIEYADAPKVVDLTKERD